MSEGMSKPGTFCWNELATKDVAAARKFYTELLGWVANDMPMEGMTYTTFKVGDTDVAGMMEMTPEFGDAPPHWMGYIMVEDIEATTQKAETLGAKICVPPRDIPGVGKFSVVTDPTGAAISFFQGLPK